MQVVMDVCLLAFLSAAVWMDFRSYKVSNTLIAAALASGLTFNLMLAGLRGAAWAMAGCLLLFILLLWRRDALPDLQAVCFLYRQRFLLALSFLLH